MVGKNGPLILKICVIGATEQHIDIMREFADKTIDEDYALEIGFDVSVKQIEIQNKVLKLVLLSGIKSFGQDYPEAFFNKAFGCLIFFEFDKRSTFEFIEEWHISITKYIPNPTIYLVGIQNEFSVISMDEAQTLANQLAVPLFILANNELTALDRIFFELGVKIISTIDQE